MKCWVFNEEQLRKAMQAWHQVNLDVNDQDDEHARFNKKCIADSQCDTVLAFLMSEQAADAKICMEVKEAPTWDATP